MDMIKVVFAILYILLFFASLFITFKFEWREESKDERGKDISNKSYGIVFPLVPFGWVAIELIDRFVTPLSYDMYKACIWILLTGLTIFHAVNISILKRIY